MAPSGYRLRSTQRVVGVAVRGRVVGVFLGRQLAGGIVGVVGGPGVGTLQLDLVAETVVTIVSRQSVGIGDLDDLIPRVVTNIRLDFQTAHILQGAHQASERIVILIGDPAQRIGSPVRIAQGVVCEASGVLRGVLDRAQFVVEPANSGDHFCSYSTKRKAPLPRPFLEMDLSLTAPAGA
jgi:hypothetical protein